MFHLLHFQLRVEAKYIMLTEECEYTIPNRVIYCTKHQLCHFMCSQLVIKLNFNKEASCQSVKLAYDVTLRCYVDVQSYNMPLRAVYQRHQV